MNNEFYFDNENKNELGEDNSPEASFNSEQFGEVEIDLTEEEQNAPFENVENSSNFSNEQNSFNTAKNGEFNQPFQQNYYSYQQGYQPYFQNSNISPLYHEKNAIKKTANIIGFGLLLFYGFLIVFSNVIAVLSTNNSIRKILSNSAVNLELNIILSVFGFGLAGLFILKLQKLKVEQIISFAAPKKESFLPAIMIGVGFCYVANIIISLIQVKFQNVLPISEPKIDLPSGALGFLISTLSVAVAPALIEEFLFRGVIMGSLLKFSKPFAIFTSSLLFAFVHGNLAQIPFAFLVGLVIGAMVVETNSFWTGVIIHFINNFISMCLDYAKAGIGENVISVVYLFLLASFIVMGFFGYYILSIRNKKLFSYEKTTYLSTSLQKFGWFSSTATIVIYYIIVFFETFFERISI